MRTRTTTHWLVLGAGAVLLALVVGVPLGAGAVAPAASPTASPFRTATPFPTVNPRVIATVFGTAVAEMTRTAGTPFPRPAPGSVETAAAGYIPTAQARAAATFTAQAGTATARAGASPAASPTPDPCLTPVPASAEWTTYTTKDGSVSFDYPANWAIVEESPLLGSPDEPLVLHVVIVSTSDGCRARFPAGGGVRPGFTLLRVMVYRHGLQGFSSLADRLAAFDPAFEPGVVEARSEEVVAGRRFTRSTARTKDGPRSTSAYFSQGDHYYLMQMNLISSADELLFDSILRRVSVH